MKTKLLLLAFLLSSYAQAQLTGIKTIPGDYATISVAITALNTNGVGAGGVTFNVAAGHTESAANIGITTTTGSAANPIVFQKNGIGANPLVTASTGTGTTDGIIEIVGADYITFNSINLTESVANTTATTWMEWGYALLKSSASNGSQHITITNCTVTLNKAHVSSVCIYGGNHIATATTQLSVTNVSGSNSDNVISNNIISNAYSCISISGYNHIISPYNYYDQNNDIIGNNLSDYGAGATICYGIYTIYQNNLDVLSNTISNSNLTNGNLYGIYTSTSLLASVNIGFNYITLPNPATFAALYGIRNEMGNNGTTNTVSIHDNSIQNSNGEDGVILIYHTTTTTFNVNVYNNDLGFCTKTSGSTALYGILVSGSVTGVLTINNNLVHDMSCTRGITAIQGPSSAPVQMCNVFENEVYNCSVNAFNLGWFTGLYFFTTVTANCYNNQVYNITITNSSGAGSWCRGIQITGTTASVHNNTIFNMTNDAAAGFSGGLIDGIALKGNNTSGSLTANDNVVYGLSMYAGAVTGINESLCPVVTSYSNLVYDLATTGSSSTTVYGIYTSNVSTSESHWGNTVYNLSTSLQQYSVAFGIYLIGSGINKSIHDNNVNTISGGSARGIYSNFYTGTANEIYRNNVHSITTTHAANASAGLYLSGGTTLKVYNNFVSNINAPASTLAESVIGIFISSANSNLWYNSINIYASSSSSTIFGTSGISISSTTTSELINNLVINNSIPGPTGGVVTALRKNNATLSILSLANNNNCLYASTPSSNQLIYFDGTNSAMTMVAYQLLVSPRETNSVSIGPLFTSSTDLHLADNSLIDLGVVITTPTDDIDLQSRPNGGAPEIGADEAPPLPLPIEMLLYIAYSVNDEKVLCEWQTATELNSNYFLVERSNGNQQFEYVATIPAAGNSNQILYYLIEDPEPYQGISYYRLSEFDFDGEMGYSEVRAVVINDNDLDILIYPNPTDAPFMLTFFNVNSENLFQLRLIDEVGRLVENWNGASFSSASPLQINLNHLSKGSYILQVIFEEKIYNEKIILR